MDPSYVKIRSWHVFVTWTRVPGQARTLCTRNASGPTADVIPANEKSCETCLRKLARSLEA